MVQLSEVYGPPFDLANVENAWNSFNKTTAKAPDSVAIVCTHQKPSQYGIDSVLLEGDETYKQDPYLRWSYASLRVAAERLTIGLKSKDVAEGSVVFTFLHNSIEYLITYLASAQLGAVIVPLNVRQLDNATEVTHMVKTGRSLQRSEPLVFVAEDAATAGLIDKLQLAPEGAVKIVVNGDTLVQWLSFSSVMPQLDSEVAIETLTTRKAEENFLFFTSGTTALPKGCLWAAPRMNIGRALRENMKDRPGPGSAFGLFVPNNHGMNGVFTADTWTLGATLVIPGPAFNPPHVLDIMIREQITHTILVPTMVHALLAVITGQGRRPEHLVSVSLSGAMVSKELLQTCLDELGAKGVITLWGMTECAFTCSDNEASVEPLCRGNDVSVGGSTPGTAYKIINPETNEVVPMGQYGELHFHCISTPSSYVNLKSDSYYTDSKGRNWIKTGDQGYMDEKGRLFIIGRYKEMIIRGGENISPAAIEAVIGRDPTLRSLNAAVVGAPDKYAGEVPVAIVQGDVTPELSGKIQQIVTTSMGKIYTPDEVISLSTLGLSEFPKTLAGKIKKTELNALVREYRSRSETKNGHLSQYDEIVRRVWSKAIGMSEDRIDFDAPIAEFADSITLMRVRDKLVRETGKNLPLAEMAAAGTIAAQVEQLDSAQDLKTKRPAPQTVRRAGPPNMDDVVHVAGDEDFFEMQKQDIEEKLRPYHLTWEDVEDVMPAYDWCTVAAQTGIYQTWNWAFALGTDLKDEQTIRQGLSQALRNNPIMTSFMFEAPADAGLDNGVFVTIRNTQTYLDKNIIMDLGKVQTASDFANLATNYPFSDHATLPGPQLRALIVYIEESATYGVVTNVNHTIIDASYGNLFFEDVALAMKDPEKPLQPHTSYKSWSDSYYTLRTSPEARAAVRWHVKRLKDLSSHQKALYPAVKWPPTRTQHFGPGEDSHKHSFIAPGIAILRKKHPDITAPIALKAAQAILNTHTTGHTHALFSNLEAARMTFPFIPKSMLDSAPPGHYEATDVAGACFTAVINLTEIQPKQPVISFLQQVQNEQTLLTKHASAPWLEIQSQLGKEASDLLPKIVTTQMFNWVPGMGATGTDPYENVKILGAAVRPDIGLAINAGMGGEENRMFLECRGRLWNEDPETVKRLAGDLEKITRWVTDEGNWERSVGEFVECLS